MGQARDGVSRQADGAVTLDIGNRGGVVVVDMDIQTVSHHAPNDRQSDPADTDKQDWGLAHLFLRPSGYCGEHRLPPLPI
jgi:hypothetical protein